MGPVTNRVMPMVVVAFALMAAACHGGDKTTTTTAARSSTSVSPLTDPASTTSASTTSPTTSPSTAPCGPDGQPLNGLGMGAPSEPMLLTAVTARATARCTDEVVFSFSPSVAQNPGVHVKLVKPPFTLQGSGASVTVAGARFYEVTFEPASTFDVLAGHASYTGPTNIVPVGTSHVRQMVETDAFEGVVTWIIGVGAGDEFLAAASPSPPSLTLTF